jgi:hypothetical protein
MREEIKMNRGALLATKSAKIFWGASLCLLCLLSFMLKASYSNEIVVEGQYYLISALYLQNGWLHVRSATYIAYPAPYSSAETDQVLTRPNGSQRTDSACDCCYMGSSIEFDENLTPGTWHIEAEHYLGDDCGGEMDDYGSTSDSYNYVPTSP